ncbi:tRNA wybutosine-synthesizing protein 3 homolog isoform X2 [Artemia franciscana]|uniref:tRNA wybutosine-synthesizing protein 3 homolog isoform X2 n=1 Tax=Artemia franciscana TaxID=6661 RepID=UPI0032DB7DF0
MFENVCVNVSNFQSSKDQILNSSIDLSRKGSVDTLAFPIVEFLNSHPLFFTTSSCSGRFILFGDYNETNPVLNKESSSEVLGDRKNRKEGCDWKHVSHDLVDVSSIKDIINQNTQSPLVLKFEPFIVHVQAKTLEAAQKLLSCGVQSGFRESGISFRQKSGKINKIIVAIRSTHGIEVPFRFDLVSSEFLGYIIEKVNGLMKENVLRIDRLLSELKKAFP